MSHLRNNRMNDFPSASRRTWSWGSVALLIALSVGMPRADAEGPATPNPGLHYYYPVQAPERPQTLHVDVCVYGGTPGGVAAAVQAHRMGKSAALAVFRRHVGGLTSAGLTA